MPKKIGRPIKQGVEYFPLDVHLDDKIELIEAEHGIQGFGIVIKLYQKVYANNYFIVWDKKALLVFSNRLNVDKNSIDAVIKSCLEWGVFDNKLYKKYEVLTSCGIQKRFFEIVKRRKQVEICKDLMLIKIDINAYKKLVYVDNNGQRKGKERKEGIYTSNFLSFWETYPIKIGKGKAFTSYQNIKNPKPSLQTVLDSIKIYNKTDQWKDKQFIPHPSTWLNQRRWEDEPDSKIIKPTTKPETQADRDKEREDALS